MILKVQKNQYFSNFEGDFKVSQNIEMNYFNGNEYEVLYPTVSLTNTVNSLSATNVSYSNSSTSSIITSNQVQGAIDQLFQSVSDGKSLIAEAITDKGVSTSSSASFATMASNIRNISIGTKPFIPGGEANSEGLYSFDFVNGDSEVTNLKSGNWTNLTMFRGGTKVGFIASWAEIRVRNEVYGDSGIVSFMIFSDEVDKEYSVLYNGRTWRFKVTTYDSTNTLMWSVYVTSSYKYLYCPSGLFYLSVNT